MSRFKISLGVKLAAYLVLSLIVIFSIMGAMSLQMHRRHLMAGVYQNADQMSDVIKRGTHFSMLKNERESIYRIIQSIAKEPGILKIRIYNKEGDITFSTEPTELNTRVNIHAEACIVCHSGPMPSGDVSISGRARDYYIADGQHVLGVISPIKSEHSCVAAECHAHSEDQKVLGVLDVIMQLDTVDKSQIEYEKRYLLFVLLACAVISLAAILFVYLMVYRPVNNIVEGTQRIADGELDFMIDESSGDEIGGLAESFNRMTRDLKKSQHLLVSAKAYTDNIIRSMMNSLVVVDQNAIIQKVNKATCDLLGYEEHDLTGQPLSIIFAEGYYVDVGFGELPIEDFASSVETCYLAKSGKKLHVLFSGSVVRDEQNHFQGVVCMAQDITLQTEAMRAGHMASLGELAAGVAHEINNPLNSIINFAQILIDELQRGEPIPEDMLHRIIKEGDRVSNIVRSLLSFARSNEQEKELVHLHEIMQETLALTEAQIFKDGIVLQVDMPRSLPMILGDFQQIQQVFINLINNARYALNQKYHEPDTEKILCIGGEVVEMDGKSVLEASFLDTGVGIPTSIIDKVINPFFSTKPAGQGTGLGLAISHGIISDHGGKLLIESVEGAFTKVSVCFPLPQRRLGA